MSINRLFAAALVLLASFVPVPAGAYPTRPVTLVLAFAPGGPSDVLARILSRKMEAILGQPIVIDNRPGAGRRRVGIGWPLMPFACPRGNSTSFPNTAFSCHR